MTKKPPTDDGGMTSREEWAQTSVHQHSKYFCAKCGKRFAMPHDVYDHLDREHGDDDDD